MKTLLLLGATGQVGQQVLAIALASADIAKVCAPTRRPLASHHPKLINPSVDFSALAAASEWWRADALICTLGTTMRQAGSQAAFRQVDHDYVLAAAKLAYQAGTPVMVLNSSLGANVLARSFYQRVKGDVEASLQAIAFKSLISIRPALLSETQRSDSRIGETAALWLCKLLGKWLAPRYRPVAINTVAQALFNAALNPPLGFTIIESENIATLPPLTPR